MNKLLLLAFSITTMSFANWQPNFETAKKIAKEKHELILLNFSGSDWCGPCMRLRREILDNEVFTKMADTSLVMVNADFPRNKKNQLDAQTRKQNDALADKYNPDGKFPFTLLLNEDGKVLKTWDGFPDESAQQFSEEVGNICYANK
ncbi:thioredoxin family protein [Ginsengibacter hankyongi]|uniref:Thioredoxin family protein n=1 Tax=Ginsengibacter hankyongi TaxID=2607284 RepID=A0A5J5IJ04_9BACT|nr:thioredoxin family protein [Ginsengibacter hankyongi]KAA9040936.1 thioredoxin family protein [Ginsengibacter hankyongi]